MLCQWSGGKETECSEPSLFLTWPPKCYLFYGVVSVLEKEPGMKSKQRNSRKSLLLMHPALSWCSLSRMPFTCFWFFSLYLLQVKQNQRMPQPGSMLVLSLSVAGSLCSVVAKPKCLEMIFLCDLVALLQGLTGWKMGHVHRCFGRTIKRMHWQSLEFVIGHGPFVAISALTLGLETTCPSNINSASMHHSLFFWKSERPFQTQVMVI